MSYCHHSARAEAWAEDEGKIAAREAWVDSRTEELLATDGELKPSVGLLEAALKGASADIQDTLNAIFERGGDVLIGNTVRALMSRHAKLTATAMAEQEASGPHCGWGEV